MTTHNSSKVLVLTVGTGNVDDIERTLLVPMLKSIEDGEWERVILLPSFTTKESARTLKERAPNPSVEITPLPEEGQENNADRCFEHFDTVLTGLISDGFKPDDIQVDFTRGTKAMSAALVLAAVGHAIPILRYIHSEQRDERGMVVPGTEKVGKIRTTVATARRRLDQAAGFLRQGDFGAAVELLSDLDLFPEQLRLEAAALGASAKIYAAWDRLDYKAAARALRQNGPTAAQAAVFAPTPEIGKWLHQLKQKPDSSSHAEMGAVLICGFSLNRNSGLQFKLGQHPEMAAYLRALACDLLANAERRLRDRHFEDALLRAYRVLEMIGQIRLFTHGYDSAALPPKDEKIEKFQAELEKKGEHGFGVNKRGPHKGTLTAPRELAARLLKRLADPFAQHLLKYDQHAELRPSSRNRSVLIHGFVATAPAEEGPLRKVLADLGRLLNKDDSEADDRLKVARSLSFSEK